MVRINGEQLDFAGKSIKEYLENTMYDTKRIAIERNDEIIPKSQYGTTILEEGDCVEIVSFVGGG